MLFNSYSFAIFFIVITAAYFGLPCRWHWPLLLAASCYFYMAFVPVYILILLFTILIDYCAGRLIESAAGRRRRLYLLLSIAANLGVLALFKYFNFLNDTLAAIVSALGGQYPVGSLAIILPIGLSFHTFQSLSYTIEIYRGRQPAERHLLTLDKRMSHARKWAPCEQWATISKPMNAENAGWPCSKTG